MEKPPNKPRKFARRVQWKVRETMEERKIPSVSALVRALDEIGVEISIAALGRMIDGKSRHWNQDVIEGLMEVLKCGLERIVTSQRDKA